MGLTCKLVRQIEIKAGGDVFHELYCRNQTDLTHIMPEKIHGCDLNHGQRGDNGSIVCWEYTEGGKRKTSKHRVEPDYENNTTKYTMLEGEALELYKTHVTTLRVDKQGENSLVTWTVEYEKLNEEIEDPESLMDLMVGMTKDIEAHYLSTLEKVEKTER